MLAILLKCPPAARFHFGLTGLDDNSSLYQTAHILHSDTLFSGMIITCKKLFGAKQADELQKEINTGNVSFSSAFYFLENKEDKSRRLFFLPKPDYFERLNEDAMQRKAIRKIAFLSKGVWERGIMPEDWKDRFDKEGNQTFKSECILIQNKFVALKPELEALLMDSTNEEATKAADFSDLKFFSIETNPKIADHARRRENNIFFQTDLHLATNLINGQLILPHFYFLLECKKDSLEKIVETVINVLADEGVGGGISTGSGQLDCQGKVEWQPFQLDYEASQIHESSKAVSLSLTSPANKDELSKVTDYKILIRVGRPLIYGGRLERVKMIQEGALLDQSVKGRIPKLEAFRKGKPISAPVPYYRNGKTFSISIPKNYSIQ